MLQCVLTACTAALVVFLLTAPAHATITVVKGSLTCFLGCNKNVVQKVAQGQEGSFEVVGQYVDLSTKVEITGSGVSVSYGTRKGGSNSSIIIRFDVHPNAAVGERTIKMRYAIETNGPDTFKIRVVNRGTVDRIQYRKPLPFRPGGGPSSELVDPVNLPLNQKVVLIVTGTRLANIEVKSHAAFRSVRILSGTTDTQAAIEVEFSQNGQGPLLLFDSLLTTQEMNASAHAPFLYAGGANLNIQYGTALADGGRTFVPPPIIGSGSSSPPMFIDVAPRANMLNVFRRQQPAPAFTLNGAQYFPIDSQRYCNDMTGQQSKVITVPNPVWGISNVGTAAVTTAVTSQLSTGAQMLSTQTVQSLNPGQTVDFTFVRPTVSQVRVSTFADRIGCFISPSFPPFFEDPAFTVQVNTNAGAPETAVNQANNSRNY
jgi:hypothetical protein